MGKSVEVGVSDDVSVAAVIHADADAGVGRASAAAEESDVNDDRRLRRIDLRDEDVGLRCRVASGIGRIQRKKLLASEVVEPTI